MACTRGTTRPLQAGVETVRAGDCTSDVHRVGWDWVTYMGGPPEAVLAKYSERRVQQVVLEGDRRDSIDWVPQLPGLLRVVAMSPIKDDTPIWSVPTLTHATLHDGCRKPARAYETPHLQDLSMDGRDGLDTLANHPTLHALQVWRIRTDELGWLQAGPALRHVDITRRRSQPLDTTGAGLAGVQDISLGYLTLVGADGLRTGTSLTSVDLDCVDVADGMADEVLNVLAGLPHLRTVNVWRCGGLSKADVSAALSDAVEVTESY